MRPRATRPNAIHNVIVLETVALLEPKHAGAGVPFRDLQAAIRSRLENRAFTDTLNGLVKDGAVARVSENPTRLKLTQAGRAQLSEYTSE
jgi:DNA-binding HxlR family transcriptional regulator